MESLEQFLARQLYLVYRFRRAVFVHVGYTGQVVCAVCGWLGDIGNQVYYCWVCYEGVSGGVDAGNQVDWTSACDCFGALGWEGGA